ncbi:hypothetical protein Cni_G03555 [Canna indica]|uniref:Protein odr-4 homolog n=1 Tax=Canna indica TaxID=4628 RepID=A0AAQ3JUS2_9LILI|nr:hypothetical protein Cni_G03555 [Canna indica]
MVKTVVSDEAQSKTAEDRLFQSGITAQVGLVIGKLSPNSDRGLVYDLIPTPPTDRGDSACSLKSEATGGGGGKDGKKGSKGGKPSAETPTSLIIDSDWVAEHARQVSRMLLGGMTVVGIYLWASEATFKSTSPAVLAQVVKGVAQAAPFHNSEFSERLLIHVSYSPRRWACRICTLSSGSLRPCDFKMAKLLSTFQAFRCTYNFEIRLPISKAGTSGLTLKSAISKGITNLAKDLESAKALISGNLVTEDLQLSSESPHDVEFLMPFNKNISNEECSSEEVAGLVTFSGAICASAYLAPREPISQAISDLKCDIISSLRSRLDINSDETEEEAALCSDGGMEASRDVLVEKSIHGLTLNELQKPCSLTFPRRVLVPWLAGIFICDYLQASETFEDMKDHCKEMMSMEDPIESSAVVDLEAEPSPETARSFWDVVHGHLTSPVDESRNDKHSTKKEVHARQSQRSNINFLYAILVLLSALLVGWAIVAFGRSNSQN